MSTKPSGNRQSGSAEHPAMSMSDSWIGGAVRKGIGPIAFLIAHRLEQRLLRELDRFDDRLLDDIGIGRGLSSRSGAARREAPLQRLR